MAYKTKQRELILGVLAENPQRHFTAEEVTDILKRGDSPVGKATVYRHLDKLTAEGIIGKYSGESACYQYLTGVLENENFHLKCLTCGKLFHLECDFLKEIGTHIFNEHSFEVDSTKTVFYGKCKECLIISGDYTV